MFLHHFLKLQTLEKSMHFCCKYALLEPNQNSGRCLSPLLLSYLSNSQHQQYKQLLTGSHRSSHDPLLQPRYLQKQDREWITTPPPFLVSAKENLLILEHKKREKPRCVANALRYREDAGPGLFVLSVGFFSFVPEAKASLVSFLFRPN